MAHIHFAVGLLAGSALSNAINTTDRDRAEWIALLVCLGLTEVWVGFMERKSKQ